MRDLFCMDSGDYNPKGAVHRRSSARAVILRGDRVLLMYSQKYDYYKFPGGGIRRGESREVALAREVREESGYRVVSESVREYGRVLQRQRDSYNSGAIFEQENYYYFCEVSEKPGEVQLDAYEAAEGFTPVWLPPFEAARHNRYSLGKGADPKMLRREGKVLELVDRVILKRARKEKEAAAIRALGSLDYAGMLDFVEKTLGEGSTERAASSKIDISYSRFEHTKRVLMWAKRLYDRSDRKERLRYEDIVIAVIFHDVGRIEADKKGISHAEAGMPITEAYLLTHGFDADRTKYICSLVGAHSDKFRMGEPDLDPNLLLIMEADLLDDMGVLGVVMDCMITQSRDPNAGFDDCLDHITRFTLRQQRENPMVSAAARSIWDEKTKLVEEFTDALRRDIVFE